MFCVTVKTANGEIKKNYDNEILISKALDDVGISQHRPCGGKGTCKKCTVNANGKDVLACITYINTDTYIDYTLKDDNIQSLTDGITKDFLKKPIIDEGRALAIDIGTTTVAWYVFEFPKGEIIAKGGVVNEQSRFGADVISRIEYAKNGGLSDLKDSINSQIDELIKKYNPKKCVITGNTVMLHFYTGLSTDKMSVFPFTPETLFGEWRDDVYLPGCMSAFVGADITTAVIASNMTNEKASFLVDIGTNGEMALWNNDTLICCSTAAGPAFEGAGIKYGLPAVKGAINTVYIENGEIRYTTIDNEKPKGICGSGIIDAIACMIELDIIDETGYMDDDFEIADSGVYITVGDIRSIQLAKSALRSGIDTLFYESGLSYDEVESFYIAGGFGNFINKESAAKIGLIPAEILDKVKTIGNGAGAGACMIVQNTDFLEYSKKLSQDAETVNLADNPYFIEKYIDNMMF